MSEHHTLLRVIRSRICENRELPQSSYSLSSLEDNKVKNRTALIFTLEMILLQHRMQHATIFNPLEDKKALHHLIFMKTKWRPADIRELTLEDSLFVIQDELKIEKLSNDAQAALVSFNLPDVAYLFEDFPEADWNHMENSAFLQNLMMKENR